MRALWLVVVIGCRIGFDPIVDDPPVIDEPPPALALLPCNVPARLGDAAPSTMPALAATPRDRDIALAWADAERVAIGGIVEDGAVRAQDATTSLIDMRHAAQVAIVQRGDETLIAGGSSSQGASSASQLVRVDRALAAVGPRESSPVRVLDARGVVATAAGYLLAGAYFDSGHHTAVVALDGQARTLGAPLVLADERPEVVNAIELADSFAIASQTGTGCAITRVDRALTTASPRVSWTPAECCAEVTGAHVAGRDDLLLAWRDPGAASIVTAIATLGEPMTIAVGTPIELVVADDRPRVVAAPDGYWVAARADGRLVVAPVDHAGDPGTPRSLGTIVDGAGYDLVVIDGETYATWLADTLRIARLCR